MNQSSFGMIVWSAVRHSASRPLLKHAAEAGWKHRSLSFVEDGGVKPMPNDRCAEQGDVDGPLECSLELGIVAAWTRPHAAGHQAAGIVAWVGSHSVEDVQRLQGEHRSKMHPLQNFHLGGPETADKCRRPTACPARQQRRGIFLVPR